MSTDRRLRTWGWCGVAAGVVLAAAAWAGARPSTDNLPTFSADDYIGHIKLLASDAWGGREPGSPGIESAAEYIAGRFKEWGLEPAGDDGTYFQHFKVNLGNALTPEDAKLEFSSVDAKAVLNEDWCPLPICAARDADGPLAFAGYGISAPEHEYDDYKDFDAAGKVLLVLRYEPRAEDPKADFGGRTPSEHSLFYRKARLADQKGARALIIVNPPSRHPDDTDLEWFKSRMTVDIPVIQISQAYCDKLLAAAKMPKLAELEETLNKDRTRLTTDLAGINVTLRTGLAEHFTDTRNVIGLLPGSGDTDEIVVVGAHYDHLGTRKRPNGDTDIYNGADDNASGTAGVLELAHAFARLPRDQRPRRNLIFMSFSAEEMGLLGSKHFVDQPTVEFFRIKAMYNLDMIGRYRPERFQMTGAETGEGVPEMVKRAADAYDVKYGTSTQFFAQSDHYSFYQRGVPVVFPFTGLHHDYHRPGDDWELINADGATRVLDISYRVIRDLASLEEGPRFHSLDEQDRRLLPPVVQKNVTEEAKEAMGVKEDAPAAATATEEREQPADAAPPAMPRVRLGIMPGYAQDGGKGLLVEGLMDDGPAKAAGILAGDRILQIGDQKVGNIYDYMASMRGRKPGDEVKIVVQRKDEEKTITVKLAGSNEGT